MVAIGGFPGHAVGHARRFPLRAPSGPRSLMAEVVDRRRSWDTQDGPDSMEQWPAYDRSWVGRLEDVTLIATTALVDAEAGDPRAALVDVMAVCASLIDRMGEDS